MREIKFRAWDKDLEQWIPEENIIINRGKCVAIMHYQNEPIEKLMNMKGKIINPDWKLMQYTGLKDIKGVEIYEGDVLKAESGQMFLIKYQGCSFVAYETENNYTVLASAVIIYKVIGNIHEATPEQKKEWGLE